MSVTKPPCLSGPLGELQRRGHGGAAVRLVLERGGGKMYIPAVPRPNSPLAAIIGMAAARVLCALVNQDSDGRKPEYIDIPPRSALEPTLKGEILRAEGGTREVAQALGCTDRHVRSVRNGGTAPRKKRERPKDSSQTDLVDLLNRMHTEV